MVGRDGRMEAMVEIKARNGRSNGVDQKRVKSEKETEDGGRKL